MAGSEQQKGLRVIQRAFQDVSLPQVRRDTVAFSATITACERGGAPVGTTQ